VEPVSAVQEGSVKSLTVNAPMTISGAGMALDHRRLQNNSTLTWTGGLHPGQERRGDREHGKRDNRTFKPIRELNGDPQKPVRFFPRSPMPG